LSEYTAEEARRPDESLAPKVSEIEPIQYENEQIDDTMQMFVTRNTKDYEEETAPFSRDREGEKKLIPPEDGSSSQADP